MRRTLSLFVSLLVGLCAAATARAANPAPTPPPTPQQQLQSTLDAQMRKLPAASGAYVVDLTTGQPLYAVNATSPLMPASVEKLYTTSVALLEFGPAATFSTELLATGYRSRNGVWHGALYLRGGGDPTFGTAATDAANYGGGATVEQLVASFQQREHLHAIVGRIVGDESYFDSLRGTVASGYAWNPDMVGSLSALAFNRGIDGANHPFSSPALNAAGQLAAAFRRAHVREPGHLRVSTGTTPSNAQLIASVASPPLAQIVAWTNAPSDNFLAETLVKDIGARFGMGGSTAAGVAIIKGVLASRFGLQPVLDDGSGLSRDDATTPQQVVTLLSDMASNQPFTASLAVAGETGTLRSGLARTAAQGVCAGKTGTLRDVANVAGYCQAADGHTLAFAFLGNRFSSMTAAEKGHKVEYRMVVALAKYTG